MSSKYEPLHRFLLHQTEAEVALPFDKLEQMLGFPLPDSARQHPAWWANQTPPSSQSGAWMSVGWRAQPDLQSGKVTFRKDTGMAVRPLGTAPVPLSITNSSPEHELQEDEVKKRLRTYLESDGWRVTIAHGMAHGIDIEAFREGRRWIIEVKGCGSRNAMRVNYFLGALGELLQRMNDPNAKYSVAFPDLAQFRGLWERLPRLTKDRTDISCLFVRGDGSIDEVA